jgi:hypothetical protein
LPALQRTLTAHLGGQVRLPTAAQYRAALALLPVLAVLLHGPVLVGLLALCGWP